MKNELDLEFLNDIRNNSHTFRDDIQLEDIQECPKCSSMLVEDSVCLGCNFNLNYDSLGEVLGERSFFTIREAYWEGLSSFERENIRFFREDSRFKHYINKIKLRYNDLLEFFYSEQSVTHPDREVYLYEISQIIVEMMSSGIDESDIWTPVQNFDSSVTSNNLSLFDQIKTIIEKYKREKVLTSSTSFLKYKFFGGIQVSTLLNLVLSLLLFLSMSLAFMSYKKFL